MEKSEADQQFELELYWCIQQLENTLVTKKMNPKQAQDVTQSLKVLKSQKAPLVKKRQLMRMTFGDYRAKMLEEQKKFSKAYHRAEISIASPNKNSRYLRKKSAFVKVRSIRNNEGEEEPHIEANQRDFAYNPSDNSFRFNFSDTETK
ncbi:UPF0488 protein CG14286 [Anabrus simplex]|uniref:UPF0488 protein CG14286 n=1 Tax=Anabrus simplex TaxID=316456 RepID=UPI0034DDB1A0